MEKIKNLKLTDGSTYTGEIEDKLPNGIGIMIQPDGTQRIGNWLNGQEHGYAAKITPNGTVYVGECISGCAEGRGALRAYDGTIYIGMLKHDCFDGEGIQFSPDGSSYDGNWENGEICGQGAIVFANGDKYEGEFKNGLFDGYGQYIFQNGESYEGFWENNKPKEMIPSIDYKISLNNNFTPHLLHKIISSIIETIANRSCTELTPYEIELIGHGLPDEEDKNKLAKLIRQLLKWIGDIRETKSNAFRVNILLNEGHKLCFFFERNYAPFVNGEWQIK